MDYKNHLIKWDDLDSKYKQLDTLRAFCAFFVFNCHFFAMFPAKYWILEKLHLLINAKAAVLYFFVLSGTVIAYSTYKKSNKTFSFNDIIKYVIKRYLRLFPVVLFSIFAAWMICKLNLLNIKPFLEQSIWLKHFYFSQYPNDNILMILKDSLFNAYFSKSLYNGNLWTIPYELLIASIIYIIIIISPSKRFYKYLLYFCIITTITLVNTRALNVMSFFGGLFITQIILSKRFNLKMYIRYIIIIPTILLSIQFKNQIISNYITISSIYLIILFFLIFNYKFISIINKCKFVRNLSTISYEFYGFHLFVFISLSCYLQKNLINHFDFYSTVFINYIITFITTYTISLVFHKIFIRKFWNKIIIKI